MLTIKIKTTNAAFEDGAAFECARILSVIGAQLTDSQRTEGRAIDYNGNIVGTYKLTNR